ncbi:hypothetical protein ACA910_007601 [Epithemia clementina (nom. ined.)]
MKAYGKASGIPDGMAPSSGFGTVRFVNAAHETRGFGVLNQCGIEPTNGGCEIQSTNQCEKEADNAPAHGSQEQDKEGFEVQNTKNPSWLQQCGP